MAIWKRLAVLVLVLLSGGAFAAEVLPNATLSYAVVGGFAPDRNHHIACQNWADSASDTATWVDYGAGSPGRCRLSGGFQQDLARVGMCPANSTANAPNSEIATCTCAAGWYANAAGDACQSTPATPCEAGATETKIMNVGWARALARSDGAPWQTTDGRHFFGPLAGQPAPHTITPPSTICDGQCQWTGGEVQSDYWVHLDPGATGLHPIYREMRYTKTATQCSAAERTPEANPQTTPPPCDGFVGDVQGKTTCIAKEPPNGITGRVDKGAKGTNSGAGSKPVDGGSGVGPNGEKPGAAGDVPSMHDLGGTGKGAQPSTVTGTSTSTVNGVTTTSTIKMEVKTCGVPGSPACKLDESGTPSGKGAIDEGGLKQALDQLDGALPQILRSDDKDTTWAMPSWITGGACKPWNLGVLPVINVPILIDICHIKPYADGVLNFLWIIGTFIACLGMIQSVMMGPSRV